MKNLPIINFHYKRHIEEYEDWQLLIQNEEGYDSTYSFTIDKINPGYASCKVCLDSFEKIPEKLIFKPYNKKTHEIDQRYNRFIDLKTLKTDSPIHVYILQGDYQWYFQKPKLNRTHVTVYYHRHDGDYDNWGLNFFLDKQNNYQVPNTGFKKTKNDELFYKLSFDLDYKQSAKELHFYLRNGSNADPTDFRRAKLKKDKMDIYLVQDVFETFSSKRSATDHLTPRILKAVFHNIGDWDKNFNIVWVETNKKLDSNAINTTSNFHIEDTNKKSVLVKKIEYSDLSKRRFKLYLEDYKIEPFTNNYNLTIKYKIDGKKAFKQSKRISIERLFDLDDFNQRFCCPHLSENLGLNISDNKACFKFWCPTADDVKLNIYQKQNQKTPAQTHKMLKEKGLWTINFKQADMNDILDKFYTYEIMHNDCIFEVVDPYSKSSGINATKSSIIDIKSTNPKNWEDHQRPLAENTPIIYELHIKDLTMGTESNVPIEYQGKYLGVIYKIPYLKKLGVNCVQLLPVTKFDTDESPDAKDAYNWGYDQTGLWFLPEGIYCTEPTNPRLRIKEFKEMVMAFHQNDIRVVIDSVHNHTYETENSIFNKIIHGYFYRQHWDDSFSNGSGCGNELKTERPMVRKLVCDYLKYWVEEMGVDGFRFDLMSLTDKFTMQTLKKQIYSINPNVLIYGEAYQMGWSILPYHLQSSKENFLSKELIDIGAFTDIGSRNAIRGYNEKCGLANKASVHSEPSHLFYIGQKGEFVVLAGRNNPTSSAFHYVDIHDDLLLIDNLQLPIFRFSNEEIIKRYKLAYSMLFNYIGNIVLKAGTEILTTKFGDHNSYRTEGVNLIDWSNLTKYPEIFSYFRDYIAFRKKHPAYMMTRDDVNTKFEVLDTHFGYVKGKMFKDHANWDPCEKLLIYHNLSKEVLTVDLPYEKSGWALLGNDKKISNKIIGMPFNTKLELPPLTTLVLCDNKSTQNLK